MIELSPTQIGDLAELVAVCQGIGTEVVIIGAVAYNVFIEDADRLSLSKTLSVSAC